MGSYIDGSGQRLEGYELDDLDQEDVEPRRPAPGKSSCTHGGSPVRGIPGKIPLTARLAALPGMLFPGREGRRPDEQARAREGRTHENEPGHAPETEPGHAHEPPADEFGGILRADREPGLLPDPTRTRMERAFGQRFHDVRVHPDSPRATGSTQALTEGRDIHFARGRYAPGTEPGDWLIGHELAHVVQQTGATGRQADKPVLEREADRAASDAMAGRRPTIAHAATLGAAQAFSDDDDHDAELSDAPEPAEPAPEPVSEPAAEPVSAAEPAESGEDFEAADDDRDIDAELAQIAAEGGGEGAGGEPAGGGGGGAAVPDMPEQPAPEVSQSTPEEALGSLRGARPDHIVGAMGSVKAAASTDVGQTRAELAADPPQMKSTGESADQSGRGQGEAPARAGQAGERAAQTHDARPGDAAREDMGGPGEADPQRRQAEQAEAAPAPTTPPPAAKAAPPAVQGEAGGSLSEAEVARMDQAVDAIPTTDPAAKADAGEPPKVALEGAADPARAKAQHEQLQTRIARQESQARTDIAQPMGEDDIRTTVPEEVLKADLSAGEAGAEANRQAAAAGPALALGADEMASAAGIIAREDRGAEIDAALAQGQADMAGARQQNEQERAQRETEARQEIAGLKQQSQAEDNQARQEARAEVESTRAEWQAEIDQRSAEARTRADREVQKGLDKVKTQQEQANQEARRHIAEGEAKAEAERQKGERAAEQEKSKAKRESGGFLGWVASRAKAFFDRVKQAVSAVLDAARKAMRAVITAAKKLATAAIERARQVIVAAIQAMGKALIAIGDALLAAFPGLRDRFRAFIRGIVDRAVQAVNRIAEKLKEGVQKALDALGQGLDALLGLLERGLHAIVDAVGSVVQGIVSTIKGALQAYAAFKAIIKDIAASPGAWLSALGAAIMDGIQNHLWAALKITVNEWLKSKVVELLGIGGMVLEVLAQNGIDLAAIAGMAWDGLKSAIPSALIAILMEKLVSMIVPAAGAVMAIIEGLQAAWGTLSRIVAAFGAFIAFLKAVKGGKAGPQFARVLATAAVAVLDFVSNWLLRKLMSAARKIGNKLKKLAKKLARKFKRRGKGKDKRRQGKGKRGKDTAKDKDKKKDGENKDEDKDKPTEQDKARVARQAAREAERLDRKDTPARDVKNHLDRAFKPRYKWLKRFEVSRTSRGGVTIWMIASRKKVADLGDRVRAELERLVARINRALQDNDDAGARAALVQLLARVDGKRDEIADSPKKVRQEIRALAEEVAALGAGHATNATRLDRSTAKGMDTAPDASKAAKKGGKAAGQRKMMSPNQINKAIKRGQAPQGVKRVDTGKVKGEQTHVHFDNGAALNIDGSWKHGSAELTSKQREWLMNNGWTLSNEQE